MRTNLCRIQILEVLGNGDCLIQFEDFSRHLEPVTFTIIENHELLGKIDPNGLISLPYSNHSYLGFDEYTKCVTDVNKKFVKTFVLFNVFVMGLFIIGLIWLWTR